MTWSNRYKLPWAGLDDAKIAAAAAEVLRRWPEIQLAYGPRTADHVSLYFEVPAALARRLDEGNPWAGSKYDGDDPVPIEIEFDHYAAMPEHELEASIQLSFDSGHSGNSVAITAAVEIAEAMGRFFGVECEPL